MTVNVSKEEYNFKSKLKELDFDRVPYQKMPEGSIIQTVGAYNAGVTVSTGTPTVVIETSINVKHNGSRLYMTTSGDANSDTTDAWKWMAFFIDDVQQYESKVITSCADITRQDAYAMIWLSDTISAGYHTVSMKAWNGSGTTTYAESSAYIQLTVMEVRS